MSIKYMRFDIYNTKARGKELEKKLISTRDPSRVRPNERGSGRNCNPVKYCRRHFAIKGNPVSRFKVRNLGREAWEDAQLR